MLKILSSGIKDILNLDVFIQKELEQYNKEDEVQAVAGWGHKATARKARALSARLNVPYIALEDGFIRSYDLGVNNAPMFSMSVDSIGCYYDARQKSSIEHYLEHQDWFDASYARKSLDLIKQICKLEISKYNRGIRATDKIFKAGKDSGRKKLLIIDQTLNDASLTLGLAMDDLAKNMAYIINKDFCDHDIYIKVHPDVLEGKKQGVIDIQELKQKVTGLEVIDTNYNAISLLKLFDTVFAVTSQMGFEALLLNKKVYCFGTPFYAGYGLTHDLTDNVAIQRRSHIKNVSIELLFAASYLKLCRYINPITKKQCSIDEVINLIALQKEKGQMYTKNFVLLHPTAWKRELVEHYLKDSTKIYYTDKADDALSLCTEHNATLVQWASRADESIKLRAQKQGIATLFIEDGFVRSKGLGSTYEKPMSLVLDTHGIYYDPMSGSQLDTILNNINQRDDYEDLIKRAELLIDYLNKNNITKYNVGTSFDIDAFLSDIKKRAGGREIILLPGQVETDASVKKAGGDIQDNLTLLQRVREHNKDAFIIYKPHPDVMALTRKGSRSGDKIDTLCDMIVSDFNIAFLYNIADKVCVLSSQSGFEALLRGCSVEVYGRPFYSGWGLTHDMCDNKARYARLNIKELVAGVLILYPTYFDWHTKLYANVEDICTVLSQDNAPRLKDSALVKVLRLIIRLKQKLGLKRL